MTVMTDGKKIVFVSDFDGTITDEDFFTYTSNEYFDNNALKPWREYLAGKKTHFQALKEMFAQIRVPEESLEKLISEINVDSRIDDVFRLCNEKNIKIYICSAGNDYYIKKMIGKKLADYDITLVTNKGEYSQNNGLAMTAPLKSDKFYDKNIGISKFALVNSLKEDGDFVIFAGDGPPDFEPAKIADVVFARKMLLEECRKAGIKTEKFNNFADIYNYIREI
jgi:2,3-diketo-5-methylthio-1-phosphopentane phosphatase